jgi:cellulose synthase/poly-beta-1,6-N-acetylglucosamine synthase-like glycosyltransferase
VTSGDVVNLWIGLLASSADHDGCRPAADDPSERRASTSSFTSAEALASVRRRTGEPAPGRPLSDGRVTGRPRRRDGGIEALTAARRTRHVSGALAVAASMSSSSISLPGGILISLLCTLYLGVLVVLSVYGFHRSYLVAKCLQLAEPLRRLREVPPPASVSTGASVLPRVTVQLPLYNEATVAVRLLEQVARLEYPRSRLEIQVLDDSDDETSELLRPVMARLRGEGLEVVHLQRRERRGYKAGALDAGLAVARGELVAMFDADFLPDPDFLLKLVPHFANPRVAMVQGRWGHLNRDESLFTRVGALMLDGHHVVENRVRAAAGWLFNFAGTGGMWRKEAITDSGGWQHDTLTEDLDLSYRAQLRGWKFVYREDVVVPGELPAGVTAFRAQQLRWAKGTVQTRRKLLGTILGAPLTLGARLEAFFHLTPHLAYVLTLALSVLLLPVTVATRQLGLGTLVLLDLPLFLGTTGSLAAFYALSQSQQGRRASDGLRVVPALLMIGVGLTPLLTAAFLDAHRRMAGEFVRTPKRGTASQGRERYRVRSTVIPWAETVLALISGATVVATLTCRHYFAFPFAVMFFSGYAHMAGALWRERRRGEERVAPAAAGAFEAVES